MGLVEGARQATRRWENHNTHVFVIRQLSFGKKVVLVNESGHSYIRVHTCATFDLSTSLECGGLTPLCYRRGVIDAKAASSRRTPRRRPRALQISKRGAADAFKICAVRIQLTGTRGKIVREQDEAFGVERAGDGDLLDRRLRRYAI